MSKKYFIPEIACFFIPLAIGSLVLRVSILLGMHSLAINNLGIGNSTDINKLPTFNCKRSTSTMICGMGCGEIKTSPYGNTAFMAIFSEFNLTALYNACDALTKSCNKGNTHSLYHFSGDNAFNNQTGLQDFTGNCEINGWLLMLSILFSLASGFLLLASLHAGYNILKKCMEKNNSEQLTDNTENNLLENTSVENQSKILACLSSFINSLPFRKKDAILNERRENYMSV